MMTGDIAVSDVPPASANDALEQPDDPIEEIHAQSGEFERQEVPASAFQSYLSFLAIFGGRHTAGTEFSIGPLFLVHGASARDVIVGLFLGNILATLSWRFVCAPVAVRMRYTTYYQLERICGPRLLMFYNLFVGIILSVLAGAMCTVSATSVGALFDVRMPGLHDWVPSSFAFSAITVVFALLTALVAGLGYSCVSRFSLVLVPYMFSVIIYMGFQSLRMLEIDSLASFWEITASKVWTDREPEPGFSKFGLWHCVCSAWFCDLMLHLGMLDLTILRYGKSARVGWCSALGMFAGHYFTWIVAGMLYALQLQAHPDDRAVKPGPMAEAVAGSNGLICVVVAGWSTANPLIYEAGLAFQAVLGQHSNTRKVTFCVGVLAGIAGLFPAVVMRILELLALAGLVILPMGIVLFCDCLVFPKLQLQREAYENNITSWPAVATWLVTNAIAMPLALTGSMAVFFLPLPSIFLAAVTYIGGSWIRDRKLITSKFSPESNKHVKASDLDVKASASFSACDCKSQVVTV
eukprot:TRINITY_DN28480_c0_g1_i1.p1 TRINITY_DN28480_c0_g1~~TRINITY_DN28480_c0_g1_i1.p1  ORF type:complete len:532 (-),score=48.76 TRINITY_DN28480_c0_g1_i1:276-1841(-)